MAKLTVFFDGACPLCVREISLLRRFARNRINFEDVSPPDASPSCSIDRETLMARFHPELPSCEVVDGARAFTEAWSRVPGLGCLVAIGRFGPSRATLNALYAVFLKVRPSLQRLVR